jgi:hypothetical protein
MKIEVSKKVDAIYQFKKAVKKIMTTWLSDSVKELKQSALSLKKTSKRKKGGKSSQLARNIDFKITEDGEGYHGEIGTGVGKAKNVVYAYIQDKGGTIRKKNKMLTIPLGNTKGTIANFEGGFFIKSKKGNVLYCMRDGKKIKPLFLLKDEVNIPATNWFSSVMERREKTLKEMLKPENVFTEALKIAGGK